ncbi:MAG TPA: hypothetical protein VFK06_22870 [Candidatus Angelobacter sp.]|nr:hypothetical protein [Candidatus Angelobacter sp.]
MSQEIPGVMDGGKRLGDSSTAEAVSPWACNCLNGMNNGIAGKE